MSTVSYFDITLIDVCADFGVNIGRHLFNNLLYSSSQALSYTLPHRISQVLTSNSIYIDCQERLITENFTLTHADPVYTGCVSFKNREITYDSFESISNYFNAKFNQKIEIYVCHEKAVPSLGRHIKSRVEKINQDAIDFHAHRLFKTNFGQTHQETQATSALTLKR